MFDLFDTLAYGLLCVFPDTPAHERGTAAARIYCEFDRELPALIALHMKRTPYQGGSICARSGACP